MHAESDVAGYSPHARVGRPETSSQALNLIQLTAHNRNTRNEIFQPLLAACIDLGDEIPPGSAADAIPPLSWKSLALTRSTRNGVLDRQKYNTRTRKRITIDAFLRKYQ